VRVGVKKDGQTVCFEQGGDGDIEGRKTLIHKYGGLGGLYTLLPGLQNSGFRGKKEKVISMKGEGGAVERGRAKGGQIPVVRTVMRKEEECRKRREFFKTRGEKTPLEQLMRGEYPRQFICVERDHGVRGRGGGGGRCIREKKGRKAC